MPDDTDPVAENADGDRDLYGVSTWEPRTAVDAVATALYRFVRFSARAVLVGVALLLLVAQFVVTALASVEDPFVGAFAVLSVLPALAVAAYVWYVDPTVREQWDLLVVTFLLGGVLASFAALVNSVARPAFQGPVFGTAPLVGTALFFYLVVGPVEETVKWLAVRLWAFESPRFRAVVDGAVYGAMAGLGFASIENTVYIVRQYVVAAEAGAGVFFATFGTAAVRSLAGPGHVLYSAVAGYYLGLAKFNREHYGPIVTKGLLLAALAHGTYNTLVTSLPEVVEFTFPRFLALVVVFDGVVGYGLYRLLSRYRREYDRAGVEVE